MRRQTKIGAICAIVIAAGVVGTSSANAQNYYGSYGPGMMGPGMMMGTGMMGYGMMNCPMCGPNMMGWGYGPQQANLNLSANDVKSYLERMVAMMGNPHLAVGQINEKDAGTITADIVTKEKGDVVQRYTVDRHTGVYRPMQ